MKNIKKQTKSGLCGLYNLANALQNDEILSYEEQDQMAPFGNYELNKVLGYVGYEISIDSLIFSPNWDMMIPNDYLKYMINGFIKCTPEEDKNNRTCVFLLGVQMGNSEFTIHATTLIYLQGKYYYSDPHWDGFVLLRTIDEMFKYFRYVSAISTFMQQGEYINIWADKSGHNELLKLHNEKTK